MWEQLKVEEQEMRVEEQEEVEGRWWWSVAHHLTKDQLTHVELQVVLLIITFFDISPYLMTSFLF